MPSRATCGLKVAKLRDSSPSKWCELVFQFASIGRWQPPELVVHDRWQVKQAMRSSPWARSVFATPGPQAKLPSSAPERDISLARAALALKCGPGVTACLTRLTCHSSLGSTIERWISPVTSPSSPYWNSKRSEEHTSELQS